MSFIELCGKIGPIMSADLYNAVAQKFALCGLEVVILRRNQEGEVEILLTQRPVFDKIWPNQWHSPGSMVRSADAPSESGLVGSFAKVFKRVEEEVGATLIVISDLVGCTFQRSHRGAEIALVYVCQVVGDPAGGKYFPVEHLPEPFIDIQRQSLQLAVDAFRSSR